MTNRSVAQLCAAVLVVVGAFACAPPPNELCTRGVDLTCTRQFECQSDAVKSSDAFKAGYGATAEECKTKLAAFADCASKKTENELCMSKGADGGMVTSPTGGTFNLSKAAECSDQTKALSCADYLDATKLPEACKQKCGPP
ncbi:MAG: hypothetical protein ACYC8T_00430 [Myxococcaceae bacterium]